MGPLGAQMSLFLLWGSGCSPAAWIGVHMPGLKRTAQGSQMESVWATGTHLPNPSGHCCGTGTLPLLSSPGALGAHGTPRWAWACWLLKASYHVGAPGSAP